MLLLYLLHKEEASKDSEHNGTSIKPLIPKINTFLRSCTDVLILQGGCIDDFLSHLMCCCCALVQELREVEIRGVSYGKILIHLLMD